MADTLDITEGAGTTIATDDVGGVHYQRIKLTDGTADSSTPINVDIGAKANALRVAPANDITDATYIGDIKFGEAEPNSAAILADTTAILADTAAIQTAVELLDNAIDGNYLNVNANIAGTDIVGGAGVVAAGVQRITLASDDPGVALLTTIDSDTSDIATDTGTIASDTSSIDGKITACNTGAVVVASGAITVSGTVTADLSATDNAVLDTIDAALDAINAKLVTGTVIGDVNLGATDNAVLDDIAANQTDASQKTQIVDGSGNVIGATSNALDVNIKSGSSSGVQYDEDSAHVSGDTGTLALVVRSDAGGTLCGTDGDYGPLQIDANGALRVTGGGGGTEYTEDIATANPIVGTATMMERDDVIAELTPVEGDWASLRCSAEGALWTQDFNSDASFALLGTIDADTSDIATDTGTIATDTTSIDGKITACNTGAVVVASGAITETNSASLAVVGGGTEATALRVTLANDSTGVITVDGTITADLSATDNAVLDAIDTVLDLINAKLVTGTVIGDVNLGATDNAVLDTIAGDTTAIETAVQIIDDWDATHDSAASADGSQVMAVYDSTKPTAVGNGDAVRVLADSYGRLLHGVEPQRFQSVFDSANATAEANVVKASAASTIVVVQSYVISSDVEGWIKLQDEDSTALTGKFWLKAGGGVAITLPENAPIVLGTDKDLEVICEAAGDVSVSVTGYTIPG